MDGSDLSDTLFDDATIEVTAVKNDGQHSSPEKHRPMRTRKLPTHLTDYVIPAMPDQPPQSTPTMERSGVRKNVAVCTAESTNRLQTVNPDVTYSCSYCGRTYSSRYSRWRNENKQYPAECDAHRNLNMATDSERKSIATLNIRAVHADQEPDVNDDGTKCSVPGHVTPKHSAKSCAPF